MELISVFDIIWSIILILIIMSYGKGIQNKNIKTHPHYQYFTKGLIIKIMGGVLFCLIYALYYGGGDTVNYYQGVKAMYVVFLDSPITYLQVLFEDGDSSFVKGSFWNVREYPPTYMLDDYRTFTVIKISSLMSLPAFGGFLGTTVILATLAYNWVWKLYHFIALRYPNNVIQINWAILFLPSTVFWGSGIMKDTFTFAATCYAVYGINKIFIEKKSKIRIIFQLIFSLYLIITIKSYIIFALLPGLIIFANFERLRVVKSVFVKILIIPIITILFFLLNTLIFDMDELFGRYSADRLLEEAVIQNQDLQRDVYGSNSFNIGEFEPTLAGAASKFLPAINAAIFRPYLWEVGSPTMLFSAIENSVIMVVSLLMILGSPFKFFSSIGKDPFLLFCLIFTIMLAFGVGLSTSNFGALVRYKIPFMPFYLFMVLYIRSSLNSKNS